MRRLQPLWPVAAFIALALAAELSRSRLLLAITPFSLVPLPFVLARGSNRRVDPLEPIWLFAGLMFFSYGVVGALQLWNVEKFMSLPGFLRLDGPHYVLAVWLGGLGFIALCTGYEYAAGRQRQLQRTKPPLRLVTACCVTGAALIAYGILSVEATLLLVDASAYPIRTILTGGLRDAMFLALPGRGYLSVGFSALTIGGPCLCLALALRAREAPELRRWVLPAMALTAAVSAVIFVAILGSRQLMMATLIELLVVYHFAHKRVRPQTIVGLAVLLAGAGVAFISLRNRGSLTFDPIEAAGLASRTFDGFNFLVAAISRPIEPLWGQTLGEDLIYTYLPRSLFPDKPTVFGIITAQDAIVPGLSSSVKSGTFPPGILAEGYVNFGVAGVLLLPLLLGASARMLYRRAELEAPFFVLALGWLLGNSVGAIRGLGPVLPALATVTILLSPLLLPPFERLGGRAAVSAIGSGTLVAIIGLAFAVNPVVSPERIAASKPPDSVGAQLPAALAESEPAVNVLVIWASWCKGCREQLRRVASIDAAGGVELSSVAYQDDPKAAQQVLESTGAAWSHVLDDGPILRRLGTDELPATYVLNRHREVACVLVGRTDVPEVRAAVERLRRSPGRLGPC